MVFFFLFVPETSRKTHPRLAFDWRRDDETGHVQDDMIDFSFKIKKNSDFRLQTINRNRIKATSNTAKIGELENNNGSTQE